MIEFPDRHEMNEAMPQGRSSSAIGSLRCHGAGNEPASERTG